MHARFHLARPSGCPGFSSRVRWRRIPGGRFLALAGAFLAWEPLVAQTTYLKADNATALDDPASWSPTGVPGAADTLLWNGTYATPSVSVGVGLGVRQLRLTNVSSPVTLLAGSGSLTLGNGGIDLSAAAANLDVAAPVVLGAAQTWSAAAGRQILLTGSLSASGGQSLTINAAGATGTVVLSPGAGESVQLSGSTTASAALLLQARSGGALLLGGDGVTAPLTGSVNSIVSTGTHGALAITGGGLVRVQSGTWNLGDLGRNGASDFFSGTLDVRGGVLSLAGARYLAGGNITVSGGTLRVANVGSIYSNGGKFALGSSGGGGAATLTVSGGLVDLAQANGSVNGGNSLGLAISSRVVQTGGTVQSGVTVGGGTNGGTTSSLTIGNTGLTSTGSGATLTYAPASNVLASYTLAGGTLLSAGAIQGNPPAASGTNGSAANPPAAVVTAGTGNIRNFNFQGGTLATASFVATSLGYASATGVAGGPPHADPAANSVGIGTLTNHGGTLAPGGVGIAGRTTITGNYAVNAGTFAVDVGGTTQATAFQTGQYDLLSVSGTVMLGGDLAVRVLPGFTPGGNATFTVLSATGTLSGAFRNVAFGDRVVTENGLGTFVVAKSGNTVTLGQYLPVIAPVITGRVGPATVLAGNPATFSVTAGSLAPVTYQWRKNGTAIDGATSATLTIPAAQGVDGGNYDVIVTNAAGSVTSAPFPLAVTVPASTESVVIDAGDTRRFDASPAAIAATWRMNGAVVGTGLAFTYAPDVNAVGTHWLQVRETLPGGGTVQRDWGVRVRIVTPESAIKLYVSPTGSDGGTGSIGSPFRTLEKARDTLRAMGRPLPPGGATVFLRGGTHVRTASFTLTPADSGTAAAPVTYAAFPGETVVISGAKTLLSANFAPLAASEVSRVAPGVDATRIWEVDLVSLGVNRRGPFPNTFGEWQIFNALAAGSSAGIFELFSNGKRMPLSRYPNRNLEDDALTTNLKMNGVAVGADNAGTGYLNAAGSYTDSGGNVVAVGGAFHYSPADATRVARWQTAMTRGGVWVVGYWRVPWQVNGARVGLLDTGSKQVIALASGVNISNGIGYKYARPAGSKAEPYWVVNLLEELDQPGEWCIDFSRGRLYFLMDAAGAPPDNRIAISDLGAPLVQITGSYVNIQGLTFEYGLAQGVQILGGSRNLVAGCTFRNMGGYPVDINNLSGGSFNGVMSCTMSDLASGGVLVRGGNNTASPRVPTNNFVVNNRIRDYARVVRVYAAAVDVGYQYGRPAVGVRVAHNATSGSPHVGMLWRDFDHVIEYNDIGEYCQFSNDMGGIYTFASNYVSNTVIRYNSVHDSPHGEGIYFDSDHINATVYGNVVNLKTPAGEPRGFGFFDQVPGGTPAPGVPLTDTSFNNIAVNCRFGFQFYTDKGGTIENNLAFNNVSAAFRWYLVAAGSGTYSTSASNAATLASGPNLAAATDPGFIDFANDDLRLRPDSTVYADLPEFQPIPLEMAGLYNDEFRGDARVYSPFITTDVATAVGANTATFNGTLVYPQFEANATVRLYWGPTDGGVDPAAWANVVDLGTPAPGNVSRTLTTLTPATPYFFRFSATNSAGTMWAERSNSTTTYPATPAPPGTASASSADLPAGNAFDGDPATKWQTAAGTPTGFLRYEFAGGASAVVTQYRITSAADTPARDPRDWQFLGSNDGITWTVLDTRSDQVFSARGETRTYGFANVTAYRFYQLNVTANHGDATALQIADVQLVVPAVGPDTTGPVISTPGDFTVQSTSSNGALVSFVIQATDAVSGNAPFLATPASGSLFPVGATRVNVTATDASGNASTASFTVTVAPPALVAPWSLRNIGSYPSFGAASFDATARSFTVNATGGTTGITGDIWSGTNDNFTFISQPWSGDGIFTARIASFTSGDSSAKAGVMFRETAAVGSRYGFTYLLRKGDAWSQHKTAVNGATSGTNFLTASSAGRGIPSWVRLVRSGNQFTSYVSPDGQTWTKLGATVTNTLTGSALTVGLAAAPRTATAAATVVFDNVTFLALPPAPAGLSATPGAGQVSLAWTPVPGAASYTVERSSDAGGPYVPVATGLTAPAFVDSDLVPGAAGYYVVTATNAVGEGAASAEVMAIPLSDLQAWRLLHFGTSTNAGRADDATDGDGDGAANLLEYALGTVPTDALSVSLPTMSTLDLRLRLTFSRARSDVTYRVEAGSSLARGAWTEIWAASGPVGVPGSVTVTDTQDFTLTPGRFLRLRVDAP